MNDSIETDLLATCLVPFARDEAAWVDCYVSARARLAPTLDPASVVGAARVAWVAHGWAHPAAVAHLEHELGPLDAG